MVEAMTNGTIPNEGLSAITTIEDRRALPLFLASRSFVAQNETEPLDRIRMQKGVFILTHKGSDGWGSLYSFEPYDWGPYSRGLAADLHSLVADRRMSDNGLPPRRYGSYQTTKWGENLIEDIGLTDEQRDFISNVRAFVTTTSFTKLLRSVYAAFPTYATESKFNIRT